MKLPRHATIVEKNYPDLYRSSLLHLPQELHLLRAALVKPAETTVGRPQRSLQKPVLSLAMVRSEMMFVTPCLVPLRQSYGYFRSPMNFSMVRMYRLNLPQKYQPA